MLSTPVRRDAGRRRGEGMSKQASVIASILYFPMLIFSGTTLPIEVMPPAMQKIVRLFPLTQGDHDDEERVPGRSGAGGVLAAGLRNAWTYRALRGILRPFLPLGIGEAKTGGNKKKADKPCAGRQREFIGFFLIWSQKWYKTSAPLRTRTRDTLIKSQVLYQLS